MKRAEVETIALLARLELAPDEIDRLAGELGAILEHMQALAALDTSGVEPMTHAVPMTLRLRPDEVGPSLPVDDAVGQAPDADGGLFRVPGIIERGS